MADILRDVTTIKRYIDDVEKALSLLRAEVCRYEGGHEVAHTALVDAIGTLRTKANMMMAILPVLMVGDTIKVYMQGESPWAKVTDIMDAEHLMAKPVNDLVNSGAHGVSRGDNTLFIVAPARKAYGNRIWEHADIPVAARLSGDVT